MVTKYTTMIGPNSLPTDPVPRRCTANSTTSTRQVAGTNDHAHELSMSPNTTPSAPSVSAAVDAFAWPCGSGAFGLAGAGGSAGAAGTGAAVGGGDASAGMRASMTPQPRVEALRSTAAASSPDATE